MRSLTACLAIAVLSTAFSEPAAAAAPPGTYTYDTVDAVETGETWFRVTGILRGQSAPTTGTFRVHGGRDFGEPRDPGGASPCQRVALLAMSKPGRFQLVMVSFGENEIASCKLVARTP